MRPTELIDEAGRQRIEAAVHDAERTTSGEIVVAVVRACDEYSAAGWRCGVLMAIVALLGLALFLPPFPLATYVLVQAAGLVSGHLLALWPPVRRLFVSNNRIETMADRRALRAFADEGLYRTRDATGILILVALFERRVVVLADEGVNRRLNPDESWEDPVALALDGIRNGKLIDGLVAAIERCGQILSHPLPPQDPNPDEIHHTLVLED